jgi:hypothetical protein
MSGRLKSVSVKRFQAVGAFGKIWKTVFATGATAAALAAVNASIRRNATEPEENALGGEAKWFDWREGSVFYKEAGAHNPGPPVIFIHGIGAGASSFMWRNTRHCKGSGGHHQQLARGGFHHTRRRRTA